MGYFVAIDGLSGSGKSTAIGHVSKTLQALGLQVGVFHDRLGEPSAAIVDNLQHDLDLSPHARLYFMLAVRRQVIDRAIIPSLKRNDVTIADRYYTATIAYQAYGQRLSRDLVTRLAKQAVGGIEPRRVFYLDIPGAIALKRMAARGTSVQVFDAEHASFHERVRRGYLEQAKTDSRFVIIDALKPEMEVAETILRVIARDLKLPKADLD